MTRALQLEGLLKALLHALVSFSVNGGNDHTPPLSLRVDPCPLSLKVELKLEDSLGEWGVGAGTELSLPISLLSET